MHWQEAHQGLQNYILYIFFQFLLAVPRFSLSFLVYQIHFPAWMMRFLKILQFVCVKPGVSEPVMMKSCVIMIVADVLATTWHQGISNHHDNPLHHCISNSIRSGFILGPVLLCASGMMLVTEVLMAVADALAPNRCQGISNCLEDFTIFSQPSGGSPCCEHPSTRCLYVCMQRCHQQATLLTAHHVWTMGSQYCLRLWHQHSHHMTQVTPCENQTQCWKHQGTVFVKIFQHLHENLEFLKKDEHKNLFPWASESSLVQVMPCSPLGTKP